MILTLEQLSHRYTYHCIHATTITALDPARIEARYVYRISGHKSDKSLKSYNHKL